MQGTAVSQKKLSVLSRLIVPVLVLITFCAFVGVLWCGFVNFDDPSYITDNSFIRQGLTLQTIQWALTHRIQHLYHPLTLLSFALDVQLLGTQPAGFHLENLLLHCINVVLLYLLLRRLTGATWRSALVAALWAIHPLRVESVAWVTERKDMLMGLFGLASLYAYVGYVRKPRVTQYVLMCLLLTLSLLAKPTLMVMPILMLLLDVWPLGRTRLWHSQIDDQTRLWPSLILEKFPVALLCTVAIALSAVGGKDSTPPPNAGGALTLTHQVENVLTSYAQYALMLIDFRKLAVFYPIPRQWPIWEVISSACFLAMLTLFVLWNLRKRPWLATGWFWFLVILLPVIGIVFATNYSLADRYTYLPSIGLLISVVWSLPDSLGRSRTSRALMGAAASAVLISMAVVTAENVRHWQDSASLWRHAIDVTHDNWLAECNYALALESDGQPIDAMPHFLAAVHLNPQSAQAHFNYAGALQRRGDIADAIAEYRAAVDLYPLYSKASLAAGTLLMKTDQFAAAADVFDAAAQHDPLFVPLVHCCRGADLLQRGRPTQAISEFAEALRTQPDYLLAHMGLGVALLKTGQAAAAAVEQFQAAERLNPNDPAIKKNLAAALEAASTQSSNAIDRAPSTAATAR